VSAHRDGLARYAGLCKTQSSEEAVDGISPFRHEQFEDIARLKDEYLDSQNPIIPREHRLFSHLTRACRGVIFHTLEIVKHAIKRRGTSRGLKVADAAAAGRAAQVTKASISARVGSDGCAPGRVTEMAAARLAQRAASTQDRPSDNPTARTPLNASPAAVVSNG